MANLLAEILSFGNTARRKLGDLISDPAGVLQMNLDRVMPTQYEQRAEFDRMAGKQHNTAAAQSAQAKMDQLAQDAALNAITVYHGSPHKFDKFDMSKIGTGEGAQAYGHGLYFAESPEVANGYRSNLTYKSGEIPKIGGKEIGDYYNSVMDKANRLPPSQAAKEYDKLAMLEDLMGEQATPEMILANAAQRAYPSHAVDWFKKQVVPQFQMPGAMYKVDIPDEAVARFLDWDKPLSQQAPEVQAAMNSLPWKLNGTEMASDAISNAIPQFASREMEMYKRMLDDALKNDPFPPKISNLQKEIATRENTREFASNKLKSVGVPGIRYLDGGSRGTGTGTSNFVVFDDTLPTILERNGIPLSDLLQR